MAFPSTEFDFHFPTKYPLELEIDGDTHYTDNPLRFTKTNDQDYPLQRSMGRAIYKEPVVFKVRDKVANFETEVKFKVTTVKDKRYADGLAFFIVPEEYKYPTTPGGNFAIFGGRGNVFAVVFDIDSQDPRFVKLGICLTDMTPKTSTPVPVEFLETNLILKVSYNSDTKWINASVSNGNQKKSLPCPYDLTDFFPPKVKVGLGSSTSENVAVHDAFAWDFKSGADPPAAS